MIDETLFFCRFLFGLGLPHVGEITSKAVMLHFGDFSNLWEFIQKERGILFTGSIIQ